MSLSFLPNELFIVIVIFASAGVLNLAWVYKKKISILSFWGYHLLALNALLTILLRIFQNQLYLKLVKVSILLILVVSSCLLIYGKFLSVKEDTLQLKSFKRTFLLLVIFLIIMIAYFIMIQQLNIRGIL